MENVIIPTKFSERKREQTLAKYGNLEDAAMHFLRELDLQPNLWSRRVDQLSVGQQQRVAAARAFMGEPPLIIADEPTSSLDFAREKSFLDLLKRQALSSNVGLLYVSHNQMLANNFSKIVKLDEINETLSG
jgi:putative ABC transport system ATP-binding protein